MAKITSKLQVTVPKTVADQYDLKPGDDIAFEGAGDVIRIVPPTQRQAGTDLTTRLKLFDQATERQRRRQKQRRTTRPAAGRGWTREELYQRGRAR